MKDVYLICEAHIDPIWQWNWQEGVSAALSTFKSAAELADKHDYVFCHGDAILYRYVEEYEPTLFERIKELVKLGKWRIMGGWYLQPDCNMPCGESFIRQIQIGKEYFKKHFDVSPTTAINFDSFGHTQGLVQILCKCGQDSYIHTRPNDKQMDYPAMQYIWRGLDGSSVKAFRTTGVYNTPMGQSLAAIERRAARQTEDVPCVLWGVGNHGGGPSDKDLTDIERGDGNKFNLIHSYPEEFFSKIEPTATVNTSLRTSMPGCYTSMSRVKRKHIELENNLYFSEIISSVAANKGLMKYPYEQLHNATIDLLTSEFHDILPGTCIKAGEEDALSYLYHGLLEANKATTKAFFALLDEQPRAADGEYPIAVFNPHPYMLKAPIECEFILSDQNTDFSRRSRITLLDKDGKKVNFQVIKEESNINMDWRRRIAFDAELSGMAMNRYSLYVDFEPIRDENIDEVFVYSDEHKYVEIDKHTGKLKSFRFDGKEYIKDGFCPVVFNDNADPWAMSDDQQKRIGADKREIPLAEAPCGVFKGLKSINVIENGNVYLAIECFFEIDNTRVRVEYKIYKNYDYIDVNVDLFMGDVDRIVKLELPIPINGNVIGQTAYGTENLFEDAREFVFQRFLAVDTGNECLALLNNSVYGGHYEDNTLYVSLCRGTTYCAHPIDGRQLLPNDRYTKKMDQGEHNYSFRLCVCKREELERRALEYTRKPLAIQAFPCGKESSDDFTVNISDKDVVLSAMKKQNDGEGYVYRLFNNTETNKTVEFSVNEKKIRLEFTKYEFKTVLFAENDLQEVSEAII